jgi:hypothetical protein
MAGFRYITEPRPEEPEAVQPVEEEEELPPLPVKEVVALPKPPPKRRGPKPFTSKFEFDLEKEGYGEIL